MKDERKEGRKKLRKEGRKKLRNEVDPRGSKSGNFRSLGLGGISHPPI